MKSYNTITNALNLAMVDYGNPLTWSAHDDKDNFTGYVKTYLIPYLKNVKVCDSVVDCFALEYTFLSGDPFEDYEEILTEVPSAGLSVIAVQDGLSILQYGNILLFDINGKKAPNIVGKDLFFPHVTSKADINDDYFEERCNGKPICLSTEDPKYCTQEGNPDACLNKLLIEGKMDY